MSQCERILRHMQDYGQITTKEAFEEYGITRLSGRMYDLRKAGYAITSTIVHGMNRYGEATHFAVYRLEGQA